MNRIISEKKRASLKSIYQLLKRSQLILIISLALMLGVACTFVNLNFDTQKRDRNLQNVAQAIAHSPVVIKNIKKSAVDDSMSDYLTSLKASLDDIDVISVVSLDKTRLFHSNDSLIGTEYDGNIPNFAAHPSGYYTVDETGPSGRQHRAYAAVYAENGEYSGFVMAIMLKKNIQTETVHTLLIFIFITLIAVVLELVIAKKLSAKIKKSLMGYEPDVFTAMYKMRDNILETLDEGILATDEKGIIQFLNSAALNMLGAESAESVLGKNVDVFGDAVLSSAIKKGDRDLNISLAKADILLDRVPIKEDGVVVGTIAVLHDRAEYSKLMEDLSGTRYLVDSMRANNHDFTNKLHVILGLIQMQMYDEAIKYIRNITMVQRENISTVINAVSDPTVAALLIGKIARASELNVKFVLREGCGYCPSDMPLPSEMLITVIGNLLDNAFDAMNFVGDIPCEKELLFGIYSHPGALLITVDDTGCGISEDNIDLIFENGYSTKGEGRGIGLYRVKSIVEDFGGKITVESQKGAGTSFSVSFTKDE